MARTLMAHSPGLTRTIIMVHSGHLKHNPPWIDGTTIFMVPSLFEPLKFYCISSHIMIFSLIKDISYFENSVDPVFEEAS